MPESAEEWRPIPEWDGAYEASSFGRVRSISRLVQFTNARGTQVRRWLTGRILRPHQNDGRGGYLSVMLSAGDGAKHREIHTLVCAAFHGPRPEGMQAAHNDGDTANSRADNLRWATPSENALDKGQHGTLPRGETHYRAKISASDCRAIISSVETLSVLASRYGVCPQTISKIRNRHSWKMAA